MNTKLVITLVVCGTLCILATLGLSAYLIKQLSPMIATESRIQDVHILLVGVTAVPGAATFIVGLVLLVFGLRRAVSNIDTEETN